VARPRVVDDDELFAAVVREVGQLRAERLAVERQREQAWREHRDFGRRPTLAEVRRDLAHEDAADGIVAASFDVILGRPLSAVESMACHRSAERLEKAGRLRRLRRWGRNVTHLQLVEMTPSEPEPPANSNGARAGRRSAPRTGSPRPLAPNSDT
jgi:hypothetical protein